MDIVGQLDHLDGLLLSEVRTAFPDPLTDQEKAATNAYVVLAHAVVEEYIEDAFDRHFRRLLGWLDAPMVPMEALRLAFAVGQWVPEKRKVTYKKRSIKGHLLSLQDVFRGEIAGNHGIKSNNLVNLAQLVGLDWEGFEAALSTAIADLNTLGSKRGEAGHLSPYTERAVMITRQHYPENVREWVYAARDASIAINRHLIGTVDMQQPSSLIVNWDGN